MRISRSVKHLIYLIVFCAFAVWGVGHSEASSPTVGRVAALTGDVLVVRGTTRQKAKVGIQLEESDKLETKAGGMVQVKLFDGSSFTIYEKSSVNIAQYGRSKDDSSTLESAIDIAHGKLRFFVNPKGDLKKNAKFKTKSAIMGIRGTSGVIDATSVETQLVVLTGKVEVVNPKFPRVPVLVEPNFLTRVNPEAAPLPPVAASKELLKNLVPSAPVKSGFSDDAPAAASPSAEPDGQQKKGKPEPESDPKDDSKKQKPTEKEQGQRKPDGGPSERSDSTVKPASKSVKPLFIPGGEVAAPSVRPGPEVNSRIPSTVSGDLDKDGTGLNSGASVPDVNSSLNKTTLDVMTQVERVSSTVETIVESAERTVQTQMQMTPTSVAPSSNSIKVRVRMPGN
jgi:hypothetical protein